jgi:hypothetical protein
MAFFIETDRNLLFIRPHLLDAARVTALTVRTPGNTGAATNGSNCFFHGVIFFCDFIGSYTVDGFDVGFFTLGLTMYYVPILYIPCIGGGAKPPALGFLLIEFQQTIELLLQIPDDGFRAGAHVELLKNLFYMPMHCPNADAHRLRNLLVHTALA